MRDKALEKKARTKFFELRFVLDFLIYFFFIFFIFIRFFQQSVRDFFLVLYPSGNDENSIASRLICIGKNKILVRLKQRRETLVN